MPTITPAEQGGNLAKDSSGKIVEGVSVKNWRPARKSVTLAGWTSLADGKPRSSIYIKNESATESIILSPVNDDSITHVIANDNSGLLLGPGEVIEPSFTGNLPIYARVLSTQTGPVRVSVVESF